MTPLGLLSLASSLNNHGYKVKIIDSQVHKNIRSFLMEISKSISENNNLRLIGVSLNSTCSFGLAMKTIRIIKRIKPSVHLTVGGVHSTFTKDSLIKDSSIDSIILYEGEKVICELADHLIRGKKNKLNFNILYKEKNQIVNPRKILIQETREIPVLNFSLLEKVEDYDYITLTTSRGCPNKCYFCSSSYFWHRQFRCRKIDDILLEIKQAAEKFPRKEFIIADDSFIVNKRRLKIICNSIIDSNFNIVWGANARVDAITDETVSLISDAGCNSLLLGCETISQKSLNLIKKGITVKCISKAIEICHKHNISVTSTWMIGLPYQTEDDVEKDIEFAKRMNTDHTICSILTPFPGTEIALNPDKFGLEILSEDWDLYTGNKAIIQTKWLSKKQLLRLWLRWKALFR